MRYMVSTYLPDPFGKRVRYAVMDTAHNRPVNLCWSERKDAQDYADRLNLRATSRCVPMAVYL